MEFLVHPTDVSVDGRSADIEALGNLLVKITPGKEVEHLLFPGRKLLTLDDRGWVLPE